jgi:hypothetical protein
MTRQRRIEPLDELVVDVLGAIIAAIIRSSITPVANTPATCGSQPRSTRA